MALEIGSRLAHYDVTALIREGGMRQVYQATDTKLNRQVATAEGVGHQTGGRRLAVSDLGRCHCAGAGQTAGLPA